MAVDFEIEFVIEEYLKLDDKQKAYVAKAIEIERSEQDCSDVDEVVDKSANVIRLSLN